jgi:hypothetical protein
MENIGMETSGGTAGFGQDSGTAQVKDRAAQLASRARGIGEGRIDQQKDQLSNLLDRVADTLQDDRLGGYAAGYVRRGAEYLRGQSARDLLDRTAGEIRNRPALTLGACLLAGFAIARMARR